MADLPVAGQWVRRAAMAGKKFAKRLFLRIRSVAQPSDLDALCEQIRTGRSYSQIAVRDALGMGRLDLRIEANLKLGTAFGNASRIAEAAECAERVMWLSGYDERHVDFHAAIMTMADNPRAVAESLKRIGLKALRSRELGKAFRYLNRGYHALANHNVSDRYHFDFEVLDEIARQARSANVDIKAPGPLSNRRLRIAYVVFGTAHPGSVIISLLCSFAKYHDKDIFEIVFFVPEPRPPAEASVALQAWNENLALLQEIGWPVRHDHIHSLDSAVSDTLGAIVDFKADLLVTPAVLADYGHYYLAAARPASAVIGLAYGAPQQFSAPVLDLAICSHEHLMYECLCDSVQVNVEANLPSPSPVALGDRELIGVSAEAVILFVGGRPPKLQSRDLWGAWLTALNAFPELLLFVVGITEIPESVLPMISDRISNRIRLFGWNSRSYLELLKTSDIVSDTYPFGGGVLIMEAMALGRPVVTFSHNYEGMFDPMNWSAAASYLPQEMVVRRGDFPAYLKLLQRLIENTRYRRRIGVKCQRMVAKSHGSPARMVKACEAHYLATLERVRE